MDKIRCLINMTIAFIIYPFTKGKFKNRKIWLVGGNAGELFVDNGRAIYEYLRSKKDTGLLIKIRQFLIKFMVGS